jgi:hypothetical protein
VFVDMIAKCANPSCSVPFLYLREGKLFRMEVDSPRDPLGPELLGSPKPVRKIEHFWLCGPCSTRLTLAVNKGKVEAVPVEPEAIPHAAAS